MRELEDVMGKLSEMSADDIAAHFEEYGIRAVPRSPEWCAVAQYVKQETESGWVSVGHETSIIPPDEDLGAAHSYEQMRSIRNPESVQKFITRFDEHKYPGLEK